RLAPPPALRHRADDSALLRAPGRGAGGSDPRAGVASPRAIRSRARQPTPRGPVSEDDEIGPPGPASRGGRDSSRLSLGGPAARGGARRSAVRLEKTLWEEVSSRIQDGLAAISVRRALRLLETPGAEPKGRELPEGPGRIEFRTVGFGYTPARRVLEELTLTVEAGKVTALVGPSGAGKTTAVDLLLRFYEPDSGEILVDGAALPLLDAAAVRRAIGVVSADGAIFRGTLAYNIRYNRPEATDEEARAAAIAAGLGSTLERLPRGCERKSAREVWDSPWGNANGCSPRGPCSPIRECSFSTRRPPTSTTQPSQRSSGRSPAPGGAARRSSSPTVTRWSATPRSST